MSGSSENPEFRAWEILDRVQLGRNFAEIKRALLGLPTEPPWRWLAHVIVLPQPERPKLEKALEAKIAGWKWDIQALFGDPTIHRIADMDNLEDREVAILKVAQSCNTELLAEALRSAGLQNVDAWAKHLNKARGNDEAYRDLYIEGDYALSFARCGYLVQLVPKGQEGPDLKLTVDGAEIFMEVSRFREDEDLRDQMGKSNEMVQMPDRSQKVFEKVSIESKQLISGKPGIVLLHSSNIGIDEHEFQQAIASKATPLAKVSAVIFRDTWRMVRESAYPVCWGFINKSATTPIQPKILQIIGECVDPKFRVIRDS